MERYSSGRNVAITGQLSRDRGLIALIIIAIVILIIVIILIIIVRSSIPSRNTTSGTGSSACVTDADCSSGQVCDTSRGRCVDCVTSPDCPDTAPLCDTVTQKCVNCITSTDCPVSAPKCLSPKQICVNCITDPDCGGATPFCNTVTHNCVGCITDGQCPSNAPLCNTANNFCVSCISSAQCVAPATCTGGVCCDLTPPTVDSVGIIYTYFPPPSQVVSSITLSGTYHVVQPVGPGVTAVLQTYTSTGVLLYTSSPFSADTGSFSITVNNLPSYPQYYYGYSYQVAIALSTPCGATPYSPRLSFGVPLPINATIPVISSISGTTGNGGSNIVVQFNAPTCFTITFDPIFHLTTISGLDPNLTFQQTNTFTDYTCANAYTKVEASSDWPGGAGEVTGQTWYITVIDAGGNQNVPSAQTAFTIT